MAKLILLVQLLYAVSVHCGIDIAKTMEENKIVPDIIDVAPTHLVQVSYASGVTAELGNELTPTQVKDQPTVTWPAEDDSWYTLILTDPDAPSRAKPTLGEVRHWYVGNIPGNQVNKGDVLFEYIGSGPPKDSGLHRYIFLIFKQNGKLEFDEQFVPKTSRMNRLNSSTKAFVTKYNLGNPIAGNFYQAQFDDYVPQLHAQFTS